LNKKARLFIGVDTVIMHISAANNIPVLAFFGLTAVDNWGPWENDLGLSTYVTKSGIQRNGKHIVYSEELDCIGCNQHGCNDSYESICLNKLSIDIIKLNIRGMVDAL
jgi:heptosyltransferase-3